MSALTDEGLPTAAEASCQVCPDCGQAVQGLHDVIQRWGAIAVQLALGLQKLIHSLQGHTFVASVVTCYHHTPQPQRGGGGGRGRDLELATWHGVHTSRGTWCQNCHMASGGTRVWPDVMTS